MNQLVASSAEKEPSSATQIKQTRSAVEDLKRSMDEGLSELYASYTESDRATFQIINDSIVPLSALIHTLNLTDPLSAFHWDIANLLKCASRRLMAIFSGGDERAYVIYETISTVLHEVQAMLSSLLCTSFSIRRAVLAGDFLRPEGTTIESLQKAITDLQSLKRAIDESCVHFIVKADAEEQQLFTNAIEASMALTVLQLKLGLIAPHTDRIASERLNAIIESLRGRLKGVWQTDADESRSWHSRLADTVREHSTSLSQLIASSASRELASASHEPLVSSGVDLYGLQICYYKTIVIRNPKM